MKQLNNFPYKKVLVLGLAKSGTAAAKVLLENGRDVCVNDKNLEPDNTTLQELESLGADIVTGSHPLSVLDGVEAIVKNPGISYDIPLLREASKRQIPILTEVEVAGYIADSNIIGITGSNGKTTTTTLITDMLQKNGQKAQAAGNIGFAASEAAQVTDENGTMVLELSSFQLLGVETFRPRIAVLLNIFSTHLDYHKTFENYKNAKSQIFVNQTSDDYIVYNADNHVVNEAVTSARSAKVPFSLTKQLQNGAWMDNEYLYFRDEKIISKQDIALAGEHNLKNILAAICAAKLSGVSTQAIYNVLTSFTGVEHRLQFVDEINARLFYNDSKATNVLAAQRALSSFADPVILIAGGLDRGNEFDDLIPYLKSLRGMVLLGEAQDKLLRVANEAGVPLVKKVNSMDEAVHQAYSMSYENDVILLSPACASWDQYQSFEERGDMFIQAMHTLM